MRRPFVDRLLAELELGDSSVLAVCAGDAEREVLPQATLTDIRTGTDAHELPFPDGSFDWAFVSDGLHHCSQPHRALTEMWRVARVGVIAVEASDNRAMRAAVRLRLTQQYEVDAVATAGGPFGGVDDTAVPNYIYRWTEREFEKTLRSFDPTGPIRFRYVYALSVPDRFRRLRPLARPAQFLLGKNGNTFAMIAWKPVTRWPWLDELPR